MSYWGESDDYKNSQWSSGSDTKTLVIFLASFPNVNDNSPSEILYNQMYGKILIPIVGGHKVVLLEYQSLDLQQKLNIDYDTDAKLEIQNLHKQEVFDSVVD